MVPTASGGAIVLPMTDEETIKMLDSRGIEWKYGHDGHPVAIEYPNRAARRAAKFRRAHVE